ncbi:MAG TPA: hypothetical protein VHQ66_14850 [Myxococcota bacterium]|nr:hypothetical protein [Myxococcota bacterium]
MRPAATTARLVLALCASAALAAPGLAQNVSGGDRGVKGRLVSRTVLAPAQGSAPLYVTEAKGFFVLTQLCTADASAGDQSVVFGNTVGPLATDGGNQACRSYDPGFTIPPNETLTCDNTGNDFPLVCTMTGVQTSGK